jgi:fumarate hydratase, class II
MSFADFCVIGITADEERISRFVERSLMLVTALNPHIGYDNAAKIAKHALAHDLTLKQAASELRLVSEADFDRWVRPDEMLGPRDD